MFVRNIKEFKKKTNKKKIICLDCGKKKVGIAISDENHKISMPMETLVRNLEFYKNIMFSFPKVSRGQPFQEYTKKIKLRFNDSLKFNKPNICRLLGLISQNV